MGITEAACDPTECGLFPSAACRSRKWRYRGAWIGEACNVDGMYCVCMELFINTI